MSTEIEIARMRRNLIHNHSTTNIALIGPRPPGECPACDYSRKQWQSAVEEGR